ncbi:MAG: hypothetical protein AAF383_26490 [Cyanobacteria bacterium P01_A01_bin.83]
MKKFHLAISTSNIAAAVKDYSDRLNAQPCLLIPREYALWRTDTLNVSIRHDKTAATGSLRHLGWEDSSALQMSATTDVNGVVWEHFTAQQQAAEIKEIWSGVDYQPESV